MPAEDALLAPHDLQDVAESRWVLGQNFTCMRAVHQVSGRRHALPGAGSSPWMSPLPTRQPTGVFCAYPVDKEESTGYIANTTMDRVAEPGTWPMPAIFRLAPSRGA
jgi:hypothetical protein